LVAVAGLAKVTARLKVRAAIDSPGKVLGIVVVLFRVSIVEGAAPETLATVAPAAGRVSPEVVVEREAVAEEAPGVVAVEVVEEGVVVEVGGGDKQKTRDEWRVTSEGNFPRHSTLGTIDSFYGGRNDASQL